MTSIANILRQTREEKQLTQQDIASATNIPLLQYQKYESGEYDLLAASMLIAHKICQALDVDPSMLLSTESAVMDNYIPRAVIYSTIPDGCKNISADALVNLAVATIENTQCSVIDIVLDAENNRCCTRREKWTHLMEQCENEEVDLIIVPSITMLGYGMLETIKCLRYLKAQHERFDVYFLFENIYTGADCFDEYISFYCMMADYNRTQKLRKAEFRKIYKQALEEK